MSFDPDWMEIQSSVYTYSEWVIGIEYCNNICRFLDWTGGILRNFSMERCLCGPDRWVVGDINPVKSCEDSEFRINYTYPIQKANTHVGTLYYQYSWWSSKWMLQILLMGSIYYNLKFFENHLSTEIWRVIKLIHEIRNRKIPF